MAGNSLNLCNTVERCDHIPHFHGPRALLAVLMGVFGLPGLAAAGLATILHVTLECWVYYGDVLLGTHNVRAIAESINNLAYGLAGMVVYRLAFKRFAYTRRRRARPDKRRAICSARLFTRRRDFADFMVGMAAHAGKVSANRDKILARLRAQRAARTPEEKQRAARAQRQKDHDRYVRKRDALNSARRARFGTDSEFANQIRARNRDRYARNRDQRREYGRAICKNTAMSCAHAAKSATDASTPRIRVRTSTTTSSGDCGIWSAPRAYVRIARTAARWSGSRRTTASRSIAAGQTRSATSCPRAAGVTAGSTERRKRSSARLLQVERAGELTRAAGTDSGSPAAAER